MYIRCLILLLSICLCVQGAVAQEAWMPDANLRAGVRSALGKGGNASFTKAELASLTYLKVSWSKISDLTGLEHATGMEELLIWGNSFRDIDSLKDLPSLKILKIALNESLVDISAVSSIQTLTHLAIQSTSVSDVSPLASLPNLTWLRLADIDATNLQTIAHFNERSNFDVDETIPDPFEIRLIGTYHHSIQVVAPSPFDSEPLIYPKIVLRFGPEGAHASSQDVNHYAIPGLELAEIHNYFVLSNNTAQVSRLLSESPYRSLSTGWYPYARYFGIAFEAQQDGEVTIDIPAGALSRHTDGLTSASGSITLTFKLVGVYDVDGDGDVDKDDLLEVVKDLGDTNTERRTDVDDDGDVDFDDVRLVMENFTDDAADAPQDILALLRELGVSMPAQLLPEKTTLLANYPNPFNPETWMPYYLAAPSDVTLTIYDLQGSVVRELQLGHQPAGFYTTKSRAGYWDGRNAVGEKVASGVYFYRLEADNTSALRKLVILK